MPIDLTTSNDITASPYNGLQYLLAIPYSVQRTITADDLPLIGHFDNLAHVETSSHYFYKERADVPKGTASFLCYALASPVFNDKFKDGSMLAAIFSSQRMATSNITFTPEPIFTSETADGTASAIATKLTTIAKAGGWNTTTDDEALQMLFRAFTNDGQPMAASSRTAQALVDELQATLRQMATSTTQKAILDAIDTYGTMPTGFPANIHLPDGAAVVRWDATQQMFLPQLQANTLAPINSLNRYVYPAPLSYLGNSLIRTSSVDDRRTAYNRSTWTDVLSEFGQGRVVNSETQAVAVEMPLTHAIGCLRATIEATSTQLHDANLELVSIGNNNFPLTAILIGGQHPQDFSFQPVASSIDECIIYDPNPGKDIVLSTSTSNAINTLVFQSRDDTPVKIVAEFRNNSNSDFHGHDGTIYRDTKFYLVGEIAPSSASDPNQVGKTRIFTKNYITTVNLKVSSLSQAYNVVPDLLSPRLELGLQVITDWMLATPTVVPLK